jgi:hypothetical protein
LEWCRKEEENITGAEKTCLSRRECNFLGKKQKVQKRFNPWSGAEKKKKT